MNHISMTGTYLEACSCSTGCRCCGPGAPTKDSCQVAAVWRIDEGRVGETDLAELGMVAVYGDSCVSAASDGGKLFVDERATEAQRAAVTHILKNHSDSHPAGLGRFPANRDNVEYSAVRIEQHGEKFQVEVPGVVRTTLETAPARAISGAVPGRGDMEIGSLDCDSPRTFAFVSRFQWSE